MDLDFRTGQAEKLWTDKGFTAGFARPVIKAYRKAIQYIRNAKDERDLRAMRSFNYKKMKGNRSHQHCMRLNDQYRLILEVEEANKGKKIWIVGVEDYHR